MPKREKNEGKKNTGIATANHENARRGRDIFTNKRPKSSITLIPIKRTALLQIASVPIDGIAIVVGIAARHVPIHIRTEEKEEEEDVSD